MVSVNAFGKATTEDTGVCPVDLLWQFMLVEWGATQAK